MSDERRNDVGLKVAGGIILLAITLFVHHLINIAYDGTKIGNRNSLEIAEIRANFNALHSDVREIKEILKRAIPR